MEDSEQRNTEQTTLWVRVSGRNITSPTRPPVTAAPAVGGVDDAYRIAAIVLAVLLVLALVILVVFVVCVAYRRRSATSDCSPGDTPVLPRSVIGTSQAIA